MELTEVWTLARQSRLTRSLLATKIGIGLGNGVVGLLPAFATTRFQAGDAGVGVLLAARGLGALLGAFLGQRWGLSTLMLLYGVLWLGWTRALWSSRSQVPSWPERSA